MVTEKGIFCCKGEVLVEVNGGCVMDVSWGGDKGVGCVIRGFDDWDEEVFGEWFGLWMWCNGK